MSGLYSRLKNWLQDEKLTYTDLNAEFNNIITSSQIDKMKGQSDSVAQMQATENPGGVGTEVTGASISGADEVERLRFVIQRMLGGTKKWYEAPAQDLSQISSLLGATSNPQNRIISGAVDAYGQPNFLVPDGAAKKAILKGAITPFQTTIENASVAFTSDISSGVIAAPPTSGNTCRGGSLFDTLGADARVLIGSVGAAISARVGLLSAFKADAEYFLATVRDSTHLSNLIRGRCVSPAGANLPRTTPGSDTITLMELSWIFLSSTGVLSAITKQPSISGVAPTSPSGGEYWLDLSAGVWKIYNAGTTVWDLSHSVFVGYCINDATVGVATVPAEFSYAFSDKNSLELEYASPAIVKTTGEGFSTNVYGSNLSASGGTLIWDSSVNMAPGETVTPGSNYCVYLTNKGQAYLSVVGPEDRRADLGGWYYPGRPWRLVGVCQTSASSTDILASSIVPIKDYGASYGNFMGVGGPIFTNVLHRSADASAFVSGGLDSGLYVNPSGENAIPYCSTTFSPRGTGSLMMVTVGQGNGVSSQVSGEIVLHASENVSGFSTTYPGILPMGAGSTPTPTWFIYGSRGDEWTFALYAKTTPGLYYHITIVVVELSPGQSSGG